VLVHKMLHACSCCLLPLNMCYLKNFETATASAAHRKKQTRNSPAPCFVLRDYLESCVEGKNHSSMTRCAFRRTPGTSEWPRGQSRGVADMMIGSSRISLGPPSVRDR
jgi:hypothetical protein